MRANLPHSSSAIVRKRGPSFSLLKERNLINTITRRDAIRSTGLVLVGNPLITTFMRGEEALPSASKRISPDLENYIGEEASGFIARASSGGLRANDLLEFSDKLHLYACHLETFDLEPFRKMVVSLDTSAGSGSFLESPSVVEAYSRVAAKAPNITLAQFKSNLTFTSEQLETGKQELSKSPIAVHFHSLADTFKALGRYGAFDQNGHLVPATLSLGSSSKPFHVLNNVYKNAVYNKNAEAHLELVGLCGKSWHFWCALIGAVIAAGIGIALLWSGAVAVAPIIAAGAVIGVTISAAAAANILGTIGIMSGLIAALCGLPA
jgi:hypothetical protein